MDAIREQICNHTLIIAAKIQKVKKGLGTK